MEAMEPTMPQPSNPCVMSPGVTSLGSTYPYSVSQHSSEVHCSAVAAHPPLRSRSRGGGRSGLRYRRSGGWSWDVCRKPCHTPPCTNSSSCEVHELEQKEEMISSKEAYETDDQDECAEDFVSSLLDFVIDDVSDEAAREVQYADEAPEVIAEAEPPIDEETQEPEVEEQHKNLDQLRCLEEAEEAEEVEYETDEEDQEEEEVDEEDEQELSHQRIESAVMDEAALELTVSCLMNATKSYAMSSVALGGMSDSDHEDEESIVSIACDEPMMSDDEEADAVSVVSTACTEQAKEASSELELVGTAPPEEPLLPLLSSLTPCVRRSFRRRLKPRELAPPIDEPFPVDCLPMSAPVARMEPPSAELAMLNAPVVSAPCARSWGSPFDQQPADRGLSSEAQEKMKAAAMNAYMALAAAAHEEACALIQKRWRLHHALAAQCAVQTAQPAPPPPITELRAQPPVPGASAPQKMGSDPRRARRTVAAVNASSVGAAPPPRPPSTAAEEVEVSKPKQPICAPTPPATPRGPRPGRPGVRPAGNTTMTASLPSGGEGANTAPTPPQIAPTATTTTTTTPPVAVTPRPPQPPQVPSTRARRPSHTKVASTEPQQKRQAPKESAPVFRMDLDDENETPTSARTSSLARGYDTLGLGKEFYSMESPGHQTARTPRGRSMRSVSRRRMQSSSIECHSARATFCEKVMPPAATTRIPIELDHRAIAPSPRPKAASSSGRSSMELDLGVAAPSPRAKPAGTFVAASVRSAMELDLGVAAPSPRSKPTGTGLLPVLPQVSKKSDSRAWNVMHSINSARGTKSIDGTKAIF